MQNDYLLYSIRKKKRFSKWAKSEKLERIETIKQYFNYSNQKAKDASDIISDNQYNEIKQAFEQGGTTKSK
ncbi:uncharacterized protein METZ01_LOCUS31957 [marine metagenome]|jgi:hypothetical protein|uniref:Uncharacterized protein n=1 Tax=marine metagenome TaxID=408172 RepID=A0A381QNI5_9ZZZZ